MKLIETKQAAEKQNAGNGRPNQPGLKKTSIEEEEEGDEEREEEGDEEGEEEAQEEAEEEAQEEDEEEAEEEAEEEGEEEVTRQGAPTKSVDSPSQPGLLNSSKPNIGSLLTGSIGAQGQGSPFKSNIPASNQGNKPGNK